MEGSQLPSSAQSSQENIFSTLKLLYKHVKIVCACLDKLHRSSMTNVKRLVATL